MPREISVQLYSVREQAKENYEATIRAIADMGFSCVEPAGYPGASPEEAAKLFAELGLKAPSCHGPLPVGDQKNEVIETAQLMGHTYLITGCPPQFRESMNTLDAIKNTAEMYCEAAENAAQFGMQVGYHNHDWDLADIDGVPAYKHFLELTPESVLWEADVFWVARAGLDPSAFIKEIGARGKALHFKDGAVNTDATFTEAETEDGRIMVSDSSPFLPAGTGQVDLMAASAAAQEAELIVVELDRYEGDMMAAVQESYTYLTQAGIAQGRK